MFTTVASEGKGVGGGGEKRAVREAGHSPPSSAETEKRGVIPELPNTSSWRGA
jgi:hypothetical protein